MSKYNVSMFDKIKESLNKSNGSSEQYKDILRFKSGNTYVVRLLPNVEKFDETFFGYISYGWNSLSTGQYVSALSPATFGDRCPITELRSKLYNSGNESDKELARKLKKNQQWLVNCYVIQNPTDESTEGQVKILRYGKQLQKIISEAIEGDDADEYGPAIFDLSEKGCSLRIKVEENEGGYPSYTSSRFLSPSKIDALNTQKKIDAVYESVFDLVNVVPAKSYEEITEMINIHILNKSDSGSSNSSSNVDKEEDYEEDFDMSFDKKETKKSKTVSKKTDAFDDIDEDEDDEDEDDSVIDDELDELLKGL